MYAVEYIAGRVAKLRCVAAAPVRCATCTCITVPSCVIAWRLCFGHALRFPWALHLVWVPYMHGVSTDRQRPTAVQVAYWYPAAPAAPTAWQTPVAHVGLMSHRDPGR